MKRCPKCKNDFPDDANFCPVDAGHLVPIEGSDAAPTQVPRIDTGGHELLAGRFSVGDVIGGHRTGPVYQAGDKQGMSAIVKIVDPRVFPTALLKQRTERELKQLERLDHVGVAKILGHGRREDALWIAMELVSGVPLSQFIATQGPLPQPRALSIVSQIGAALEAAAKLGVTHRDLSPKNVLIDEDDHIKLINFGMPVPASEGARDVQGVVEFVAPEQVEGRPVDQRCNIYSLGAITYTLLTSAPPFSGAPADVLTGHASREARQLGPADGVSPELSAVIVKALEKTSSKRFMTLRQLLGDLQKTEGTGPDISAPSTSAAESPAGKSTPKPGDMNKTLMGVAPAEIQELLAAAAAAKALGTPMPELASGNDSMAATSLDHKAPDMADMAAAQASGHAATASHTPITDLGATRRHVSVADQEHPEPSQAGKSQAASMLSGAQGQRAPAQAQPAPAQPAPAQAPAAARVPAGGKRKGGKSKPPNVQKKPGSKAKFRETMWFKKGELDEAAAQAAAQSKPEEGVSSRADEMEMDERYKDDGSITQQDQERLSLRTGATMMMESVDQSQVTPRAQVSEDYLVSEMTGGRNKILMAIAAVVAVAGVIAAIAFS